MSISHVSCIKRCLLVVAALALSITCGTAAVLAAGPTEKTAPEVEKKTPVLAFVRTGGIAGFHDNLEIFSDMSYVVHAPPHRPKSSRRGKLEAAQQKTLTKLLSTLGKVGWSRGNAPGVADGMQEAITILGSGKQTKLDPRTPEFRQIQELAAAILRKR